jgi:hypothetical protein
MSITASDCALSRALPLVTARANTRRARLEEAQARRIRHDLCSDLRVVPLPLSLPALPWLHELAWRTHPSCPRGSGGLARGTLGLPSAVDQYQSMMDIRACVVHHSVRENPSPLQT